MSAWGADENVRMSHDRFELEELPIAEKENDLENKGLK
jgi:hypothetical protein